ncbi:MAG: GNAT family N-acetyltransferase [Chloroflexota bacterium]
MDTFFTKNGRLIRVRPMLPEDAPYLVDLFEHMSDDSRYRRFNQTLDQVDIERIWSEAEQISQSTATNGYGLLAFTDLDDRMEVPVAGARFVRLAHPQAEIAISVRDDMQGKGIGMQLMSLLIDEARRQGINVFLGSVQNDNIAVWTVIRKLGYRINRQLEGNSTFISIHLDEPVDQANVLADLQLERN